jgi:hypothetical protein
LPVSQHYACVTGPYGGCDTAAETCLHNALPVIQDKYPNNPDTQALMLMMLCKNPIEAYLGPKGLVKLAPDYVVDWMNKPHPF